MVFTDARNGSAPCLTQTVQRVIGNRHGAVCEDARNVVTGIAPLDIAPLDLIGTVDGKVGML
jgi:hypothetical protein